MAEVCTQTRIEAALAAQRSFMDTWGSQLEQMLQMCVLLVPVHEDADTAGFWSQVVYSSSDLVNLYRTVVLRSPEEIPVTERGELVKTGPSKELRRARLGYMLAAFTLRAIRSIQVLIEMDAFRRKGSKYALQLCTRIELVKLVLKIFLRLLMPFNFYVDELAIEDAEPPKLLEQQRDALGQQNGSSETNVESAAPPPKPEQYVGRRTGRSLKALDNLELGNAEPDVQQPPPPPPPRVAEGLRRDCTPYTSQLLVADLFHHSRPLIELAMLKRFGRKSWSAWTVALLLERLSAGLLAMDLRGRPNSRARKFEVAEVNRRQNLMWWALLRC
eukprot:Skav213358  [mRNA]  locus=scaffold317:228916:230104:- [translate_table: standard]